MRPLAVFCAVAFPVVIWSAYLFYRDRHQPEPVRWLALAFVAGIGSGFLGQQFYNALGWLGLWQDPYALAETDLAGLFAYSVLGIGLSEELAKFLPFMLLIKLNRYFDEAVDGIVYASFIALGFAVYENVHYFAFASDAENLARTITGPLIHMVFASLWGYPVGLAVLAGRSVWPAIGVGLTTAVVAHGLYDFMVIGLADWARVIPALLIAAIWFRKVHLMERVHAPGRTPPQ